MNVTGINLKTLSTNLQIDMVDDILQFHNKANLCVDNKFKNRVVPHTLTLEQLQTLERSDFEISPFHDDAICCETALDIKPDMPVLRDRTAQVFGDERIDFSKVKNLLQYSFGTLASGSRPYPSGGALYPVEVICVIFSEKIKESPESGFYHYRPTANVLQPLGSLSSETLREKIYFMEMPKVAAPAFALIYVGVIAKMLVKYRYRGYRYALIETGAMYHQADLIGQSLGLRNKLYSGFNDHEIVKAIGLDNMNFVPLVVQSFGAPLCK